MPVTLQRTPQDDVRPTVFEHLKAIITEVTLKRETGATILLDSLAYTINAEANTPTNVACTSNFGGTVHVTQSQILWTDTTSGAFKHRVYFRVIGDTTWLLDTPSGVAAGTTTHVIKTLDPTVVYQVAVTSWDQANQLESPLSNIVTCFTTLRNTFIYQINETILAA